MDQGKNEGTVDSPPSYSQSNYPTANMPTSYESGPPTYTQPAAVSPSVDFTYVTSFGGVLTLVQGVLSFLAFICAASDPFFVELFGGGWIIFVGVVTFVIQVGLYLLHLFQYTGRLPSSVDLQLLECIYCGVAGLLFFTCGIVGSVRWWLSAAVRACTMFCWFALGAYTCDCVSKFLNWRTRNSTGMPPSVTVIHTTTPNITTDSQY